MGFIDTLKERAKANVKTIVLPETEDKRTLAATEKILKEGIAKVILVGNEEAVKKSAAEDGYDISGAQIVGTRSSKRSNFLLISTKSFSVLILLTCQYIPVFSLM